MIEERDEDYWWSLLCKGEKAALEFFYKKYYNLLYNYGLKLCYNPELIRDFIQDVFYKLCKSESYDHIRNVRVYLLKAMQNTIYDYYASQKICVRIEDMAFNLPEDDKVFQSIFVKDDADVRKWKLVLEAINSLPNQQKQILYLFYIKGLSHKEISEIMDINPQSSMNSIHKSMKKLRLFLSDNDLMLLFCLLGFWEKAVC